MKNLYLILLLAVISCTTQTPNYRSTIDLQGDWQFALDTAQIGEEQQWYLSDFDDSVVLPGTTDSNKKGFLNQSPTTMHLNRIYTYEGVAWYRKKVTIPENFKDKRLELQLERTKPSKVWVDDQFVGSSMLLQSTQKYDLTEFLTPGDHFITILVNNDLKLTPYGNVHIYTDETQTNWNGIIGKIQIEATSKTYISKLRVTPDVQNKKALVDLNIENQRAGELAIELHVEKTVAGKTTHLKTLKSTVSAQEKIQLEYNFGDDCQLWDEYSQPLYKLTAVVTGEGIQDTKSETFGMREFAVDGTQFSINGRTTFLRGKHDACVFPLTGHPPMDVEGWVRVFKIAKNYGINHYRFHSYCPPEAAFIAADQEGIYLQPELPFWGGLDSANIAMQLRNEGFAMLDAYANHPSFVLFSHGNEIWGGLDNVEANISAFKAYDDRPLYTMGCNNGIGYIPPTPTSEFFVGARTSYAHDTILTHTRLTHAFADSREGARLNAVTPSTDFDFSYAVEHMNMPIISHEIGQYQIFPDYDEIDKYIGVLKATNLEIFKSRLEKAGMLDKDSIFQQATGAWSALCYKAEMEAAIRTQGFAGFQLLDLQDFPGQGTALVGILDAFMDSKNVITPEAWKQSCNDVVLLLEFPKYCYINNEAFNAKAIMANYSNKELSSAISWTLKQEDGTVIGEGTFSGSEIPFGGLTELGNVTADLSSVKKAAKLNLHISVAGSDYSNDYPIWVYPAKNDITIPEDILVATKADKKVFSELNNGGKVLLFPQTADLKDKSFPGLFPPDFWNYGMFKSICENNGTEVSPGTLGLLTDPTYPLFNTFPTDFHTNWQWFSIIKASNSLILDELPTDYYPIVQVVDNLERNHKMGLIFELKVGDGKLLVCMSQLNEILDKPEAAQLYKSMLNYMESDAFDPKFSISETDLNELL
ncbi:sugar-binding domain-containing protein [uncultured Draconibacterium sp.]|uniref:sugar-binding domain-containing protein n=1 Tax=uncultured Draconibacterium sp. TaxID=1573823 RepID=UPI002AA705DB|nr:sugar-binding domain-containing protein [uncultured Draconibacterium sp.]